MKNREFKKMLVATMVGTMTMSMAAGCANQSDSKSAKADTSIVKQERTNKKSIDLDTEDEVEQSAKGIGSSDLSLGNTDDTVSDQKNEDPAENSADNDTSEKEVVYTIALNNKDADAQATKAAKKAASSNVQTTSSSVKKNTTTSNTTVKKNEDKKTEIVNTGSTKKDEDSKPSDIKKDDTSKDDSKVEDTKKDDTSKKDDKKDDTSKKDDKKDDSKKDETSKDDDKKDDSKVDEDKKDDSKKDETGSETPSKPETPDQPETPSKPETPDQPETPSKPETPDQPETPSKPETPDQPETPSKPEQHVHHWVSVAEKGHYDTVVITPEYEEPVWGTGYVFPDGYTCTTPDEAVDHSVDTGLGYRTGTVQIGSIHHNAVTKQVYVKDADGYEYCDGCNEILHK